jgi:hypothetical protein
LVYGVGRRNILQALEILLSAYNTERQVLDYST